ncbi:MAG: Rieske (2Fe-2S) protein [Pyrinomonadaceae bacterium]
MGKCRENKHKPKRDGKIVVVGKTADLPAGRGATVKLKDGAEVALFNAGGKFHAIENFCPHKGAPLADSRLSGSKVECELHGWRFDVRTGVCLTKKSCSLESYEVLIEDDLIKIII